MSLSLRDAWMDGKRRWDSQELVELEDNLTAQTIVGRVICDGGKGVPVSPNLPYTRPQRS